MTIHDATPRGADPAALIDVHTERVVGREALADRTDRLAGLLRAHDLGEGAVVALLSDLSADAYQVLPAARRAGVTLMPLDPSHTLEEMAFALNAAAAAIIVVAESYATLGQSLVPLTPYIRLRYCLDGDFPDHRSLGLARSAASPVATTAARPQGTLHPARGLGSRPMVVSVPDPLVHDAGLQDLAAFLGSVRLSADTMLVPATGLSDPAAAMLGAAVLETGGAIAVPARPRAVEVLRAAFDSDATMLQLSPTVASEIVDLEDRRVRRLTPPTLERVLITAPGASPAVLERLVELWGDAVRQVYLVPGAGVVAVASGTQLLAGRGYAGALWTEGVRIVDAPSPGAAGKVEVQRPDGHWVATGDSGRLDGRTLHLDLDDFVISAGGATVLASALEHEMIQHPAVAAVALIDSSNAAPRVHVELRPGAVGTATVAADLEQLMTAAVPDATWRFVFGLLPRTATGAVDRQRLRSRRDLLDLADPA